MSSISQIPEEEVRLHSEFKFDESNMSIETCISMIGRMIKHHKNEVEEEDDTVQNSIVRLKNILRITSRIMELHPTPKFVSSSKRLYMDLTKETSSYDFYLFLEDFGVKHGFCEKFTPSEIWSNPTPPVEIVASKWCSCLTIKGKRCRNYSIKGRDKCHSHM